MKKEKKNLGLRVCQRVERDKPVHAFTLQATTAVKAWLEQTLREETAPRVPPKANMKTHSKVARSFLLSSLFLCVLPPSFLSLSNNAPHFPSPERQRYRWAIIKKASLRCLFLKDVIPFLPRGIDSLHTNNPLTFLPRPLILPPSVLPHRWRTKYLSAPS